MTSKKELKEEGFFVSDLGSKDKQGEKLVKGSTERFEVEIYELDYDFGFLDYLGWPPRLWGGEDYVLTIKKEDFRPESYGLEGDPEEVMDYLEEEYDGFDYWFRPPQNEEEKGPDTSMTDVIRRLSA
ncbi:MAG: hypothetical protein ABEJ93_02470 [Candidatus Nanohalobium sp.]